MGAPFSHKRNVYCKGTNKKVATGLQRFEIIKKYLLMMMLENKW